MPWQPGSPVSWALNLLTIVNGVAGVLQPRNAVGDDLPTRADVTPRRERVLQRLGAKLPVAAPISEEWLRDAVVERLPVLLAAARVLARNESEARDLVQATAEIALRRGAQLRDPKALTAWLLTIQTREALHLRRRLRGFISLDIVNAPSTEAPSPDASALHAAIRSLSPRVRAAVVLHYLAGLPVADVAAVLKVSPNTVKTQLRLGLAALRAELR